MTMISTALGGLPLVFAHGAGAEAGFGAMQAGARNYPEPPMPAQHMAALCCAR